MEIKGLGLLTSQRKPIATQLRMWISENQRTNFNMAITYEI